LSNEETEHVFVLMQTVTLLIEPNDPKLKFQAAQGGMRDDHSFDQLSDRRSCLPSSKTQSSMLYICKHADTNISQYYRSQVMHVTVNSLSIMIMSVSWSPKGDTVGVF
jgi:hypothetical protein